MKISEKLPQFNRRSLLIVVGRRAGDIYFAHNGEINKIESLKVNMPSYSDKEGFFMRFGKGRALGSGSVLEPKKEETLRKFLKELKIKTEDVFQKKGVEEIYLFSSDFIKNAFPEELHESARSKIVLSLEGNFIKQHPFKLISKIKRKTEGKRTKFISEAAMKILRKGK